MKTLIIYFDAERKSFQKVTPFSQGNSFDSKNRFDGDWNKLAQHVSGGNYFKFDVV